MTGKLGGWLLRAVKRSLVKNIGTLVILIGCVGMVLHLNLSVENSFYKGDVKRDNNAEMQTGHFGSSELGNHKSIMTTSKTNTLIPAEKLAQSVQAKCERQHYFPMQGRFITFPITSNAKYKLMYCPMCKLASTYWTRFFQLLKRPHRDLLTPFDIPIQQAPPTREKMTIRLYTPTSQFQDYYKFLFVRDPYSRVLSAYVDKLFAPNPTFWNSIGKFVNHALYSGKAVITRCGADITFEEYIRAINFAHKYRSGFGHVDCHDDSFTAACHPCEVNYNFIGKMETFTQDSLELLTEIGLNATREVIQMKGKQLADEDAIMDTVSSPFRWKTDIENCISWREALFRVWRKLQIRGIIGRDQFPLNEQEAQEISQQEFIKLVKETQALTPFNVRKTQRKEAFREIYSQVNKVNLHQLQITYQRDFQLFEYDAENPDIFHVKQSNLTYFGFLSV